MCHVPWDKTHYITPQGKNNFRLTRDQVVPFETAVNLWANRRMANLSDIFELGETLRSVFGGLDTPEIT